VAIDYFSYGHPLTRVRSRFSELARKGMYAIFVYIMRPEPESKILDLGVTADRELPESNYFEKYYPHKSNITAASIEDASFLEHKYKGLKFIKIQEGESLPFGNDAFDILICSAVLEHVGERSAQRQFVIEALRVSKSFFFTTPNKWFPVEIHTMVPFIHWFPRKIHQAILKALGFHFFAKTENLNLLSSMTLSSLFPKNTNINLIHKRVIGFSSNLIVYGTKKAPQDE
jgi:SAM-dependent methyltransferase